MTTEGFEEFWIGKVSPFEPTPTRKTLPSRHQVSTDNVESLASFISTMIVWGAELTEKTWPSLGETEILSRGLIPAAVELTVDVSAAIFPDCGGAVGVTTVIDMTCRRSSASKARSQRTTRRRIVMKERLMASPTARG
ncbi:MAG: hypothetical protein P4L85_11125 [Paludisphaera borealis]|uniref:hypothetical protein n=1 Tax=Paludisphaera borealis TaxID=1387353 RepID=UPI002850E1C4|nr:hypothetical protein [Paludisphaera borealis]MDR3619891.1 hypothetical protein [Paludisphaera borealis]